MNPALETVAKAYEGMESAAAFDGPKAVARYRAAALEASAAQADFLAARLPAGSRVLEVGCGNGRLLLALAQRGVVGAALGIDVARSRIAFARDWIADARVPNLTFEAADALAADFGAQRYDAALCITGALAYFGAAEPPLDVALLARLHDALQPGGAVVLELYPHPEYRRLLEASDSARVRLWHELAPSDPWRFYLSDLTLHGDVLEHRKTFVHRTEALVDDGRSERLLLYTEALLGERLREAGFADVECLEGWSGRPYAGGETLVAIGFSRS